MDEVDDEGVEKPSSETLNVHPYHLYPMLNY